MPDVQIPGFPVDDCLWKIENIDHLDIDIDDQVYVNVYLARLNENTQFDNALNNKSLFGYEEKRYHTRVVRIRIGYLHRLIDGAVYKNGLRIHEYINKRIKFSFDPNKTILLALSERGNGCFENNEWKTVLSDLQLCFTDTSGKKGKWVVVLRDIGLYSKIIIPSWAIFQRCYAPTHKVASQMIYGHINKLVDYDKSGYLKESPTTFRVMLRSIVRDDDAHIVANLVTDPKGKEAIDVLKKNNIKLKNSIGRENNKVSLKAMFPYSNEIDMEVYGKELVYKDDGKEITGRGFYVTEIVTLKTELMFNELIPNRNNNNDKAEKIDAVLPSAYGSVKKKKTEGELLDVVNLQGVNDDVSAYLDQLDEGLRGTGVIKPKNLTILGRDHKDYQYFVSKKIEPITSGTSQSNKIGVGDSKEKDTGVRGDVAPESLPPVGLDGFIKIIDLIQKKKIKCRFLAIQNTFTANGCLFNQFNKKISKLSCYHLTESMQPRSYAVVEILHKERFSYLIEVEPKGKNTFACGLIKDKFFRQIDKDDFVDFMTLFIKFKGWAVFEEHPRYQYKWHLEQIKHNRANAETTASKIMSEL